MTGCQQGWWWEAAPSWREREVSVTGCKQSAAPGRWQKVAPSWRLGAQNWLDYREVLDHPRVRVVLFDLDFCFHFFFLLRV